MFTVLHARPVLGRPPLTPALGHRALAVVGKHEHPERGGGQGPRVEFGAGVDEECRRRASAEGEEDLVCNAVVANVTKGTVAMSLGTQV